jgi:hypothetical protein
VAVTFVPTTSGGRTGQLAISDGAPGSPHTVLLTGNGTGANGAAAVLSPTVLTFGAQTIGVTSGAQNVTVTNYGSSPFSISAIDIAGEFAQTSNCIGSIGAGASCTISVTFTPSVVGTRTGTMTITDSAPGSPRQVALAGAGGLAQIGLAPTSLVFSSIAVGASADAQSFTVSNTGGVDVGITSITASGDFSLTTDCGTTLIGGSGTCTVTVTFTPTAAGLRTGAITIVDGAPGSPHVVTVRGTGQ